MYSVLYDVCHLERDCNSNCMCLLEGHMKLCSCMFVGSSVCNCMCLWMHISGLWMHISGYTCVHAELLDRTWPHWPSPVLILMWPATFCESWVKTMLISGALTSLGLTESVHASMDAVTVSTKPVTDLDVALSFSSNVSTEVLLEL